MSSEFNVYGIFTPNFTTNSVVGIIEKRLADYTKVNDKLGFLNAVLKLHNEKNFLAEDELMFEREKYKNHHFMLERMDAYNPILSFLKDSISEIQDFNNKKGVISFVMNEAYFGKITELYEIMIDVEIGFISKQTKESDFTKIFLGITPYEINSPVVWMKKQSDLIRLFVSLEIKKYILRPKNLSKSLDLCFDDKVSGKKFTYDFNKAIEKAADRDSRNQKDIDKVLAIF
tara:strand:- start:30 stop:719 length:690 start_codon:yes stop_codon:yes gene_type:complete